MASAIAVKTLLAVMMQTAVAGCKPIGATASLVGPIRSATAQANKTPNPALAPKYQTR
jgi:hypothetical protein